MIRYFGGESQDVGGNGVGGCIEMKWMHFNTPNKISPPSKYVGASTQALEFVGVIGSLTRIH
jgi:hypothetical protein